MNKILFNMMKLSSNVMYVISVYLGFKTGILYGLAILLSPIVFMTYAVHLSGYTVDQMHKHMLEKNSKELEALNQAYYYILPFECSFWLIVISCLTH